MGIRKTGIKMLTQFLGTCLWRVLPAGHLSCLDADLPPGADRRPEAEAEAGAALVKVRVHVLARVVATEDGRGGSLGSCPELGTCGILWVFFIESTYFSKKKNLFPVTYFCTIPI